MDFVGAVCQIVPVILLAMVVEARLIRLPGLSRLDLPEVKKNLIELDGRFAWYAGQTARTILHPIWTLLGSVILVIALLGVEAWCLWALYNETAPTKQGAAIIVAILLVGLFLVALYPLIARLAQFNVDNGIAGLGEGIREN